MGMTEPRLPAGYTWCTTSSRRRRHISNDLEPDQQARKGCFGTTLCGTSCQDEKRANYYLTLWAGGKTVQVMNLPPCMPCTRKIGKIEADIARNGVHQQDQRRGE